MNIENYMLSDEDIAKAKKDKNLLKKIYLNYINQMYSYAFYIIGNRESAEDIVSEAFIKAFKNINNFEGTVNDFKNWIYRITRNTAYDYIKKQKMINLDLEDFNNIPNADFDDIQKNIKVETLWNAVSQIKPESREILILKFKREYSNKEISLITGKTEENIRQIISRSIKQIKKLLNFKND